MVYINVSFKINFKVFANVDNDHTQNSTSIQSFLVFSLRFGQKAVVVCKIDVSGIST
jgi:hypothetical protein